MKKIYDVLETVVTPQFSKKVSLCYCCLKDLLLVWKNIPIWYFCNFLKQYYLKVMLSYSSVMMKWQYYRCCWKLLVLKKHNFLIMFAQVWIDAFRLSEVSPCSFFIKVQSKVWNNLHIRYFHNFFKVRLPKGHVKVM